MSAETSASTVSGIFRIILYKLYLVLTNSVVYVKTLFHKRYIGNGKARFLGGNLFCLDNAYIAL